MEKEKTLAAMRQLGLSDKEAKAYLALLGLGEATATRLAERSGITRTLIYGIIGNLSGKGLVSSIVKEGVRHFSAAEPDLLLREQERRTEMLRDVMPGLKAMMARGEEGTEVQLFRGRKGLNSVLKMIIEEGEDYFITGGGEEACTFFEHENRVFVGRAEKAGLKGKILVREGDDFFIGRNEEYRYLPPQLISLISNMVWGDRTAVFVWSEPYHVIVIRNRSIAESNLSTFNHLWGMAKKPSKRDIRRRMISA